MFTRLWLIVGLTWLGVGLAGCRLPGREGPVSPALAKCREYSQQGAMALEQGRTAQAEELLAKAVKSCPKDVEARRRYAEALWSGGRRTAAIAELERAVDETPENVPLRIRFAEMRLAVGQLAKARADVEAALDLDPECGDAWAVRARVLHAAGDREGALSDYHRALGYKPDNRELLLATAELYREQNQPKKALALLHQLIDTYGPDQEPQQVVYLEAMAYGALGRYDQAAERYAVALTRGAPNPELLYQLAVARSRAGQPREALSAAEAALRLAPNHVACRHLVEQLGGYGTGDGVIRR